MMTCTKLADILNRVVYAESLSGNEFRAAVIGARADILKFFGDQKVPDEMLTYPPIVASIEYVRRCHPEMFIPEPETVPILLILRASGLVGSVAGARRAVEQGLVFVNGQLCDDPERRFPVGTKLKLEFSKSDTNYMVDGREKLIR